MVEKMRYFLDHQDEEEKISANGCRLVRPRHTYEHREEVIVQAAQGLLDHPRPSMCRKAIRQSMAC